MIVYDSITGKIRSVSDEEISELIKLIREITNDQSSSSEISTKDFVKILLRKKY